MTIKQAIRTQNTTGTTHQSRARYYTSEYPFRFSYPPVPARQFLAERDQALDAATPTGAVALDAAVDLGVRYPATTPTLLCRYLKIRAGEPLRTHFAASGAIYYVMSGCGESHNAGEDVAWGTGDLFCFPGGSETPHRAAGADCLLFGATDEPLLSFGRLIPSAAKDSVVETVHLALRRNRALF